ncbi:MAG: hypothetical protein LC643_06775 [Bacteroidales bacterium]|nr:hypothetical protein [Bacteroidales bacterium]
MAGQTSVSYKPDLQLQYLEDENGNRIPDFSYCGYKASEVGIPEIEARIQLKSELGDATTRIQQAIDYVSSLDADNQGFRGAVQLAPGIFSVEGHLSLHTSGVVLRGSGMGSGGTVLMATGKDRRTLIQVHGEDRSESGFSSAITDDYLPVNSVRVQVTDATGFKVGQSVIVHRPSVAEWIDDLNMSSFGGKETSYIGWKPGQRDIRWERSIIAVDGNTLVLDVPLTTAIDQKMGGGTVTEYRNDGRIAQRKFCSLLKGWTGRSKSRHRTHLIGIKLRCQKLAIGADLLFLPWDSKRCFSACTQNMAIMILLWGFVLPGQMPSWNVKLPCRIVLVEQ